MKASFELETEAGLLSKEHPPTSGRAGSSQRAHLALSTGWVGLEVLEDPKRTNKKKYSNVC